MPATGTGQKELAVWSQNDGTDQIATSRYRLQQFAGSERATGSEERVKRSRNAGCGTDTPNEQSEKSRQQDCDSDQSFNDVPRAGHKSDDVQADGGKCTHSPSPDQVCVLAGVRTKADV